MEILEYLRPLRRWWWLIGASVIIATVSASLATRELPPVYLARTTLLVGKAALSNNPDNNEFALNQTLAQLYAQMAMREPVANATMASLGLEKLPEYSAQPSANGQFLEITVTDSNPELAQLVANELAKQLIRQTPTEAGRNSELDQFVEQQLINLQTNITKTQQEIEQKKASLADLVSAAQIAATQEEIRTLETRLTSLQTNFSALFAKTDKGAANTLTPFEPAAYPTEPVGPQIPLIILLAALSGLLLSVGAAYLIEFLDDTLKTSDEVARLTQHPIIGYLGDLPRGKQGYLSVADKPRSVAAEAFRSLRTNLEFANVDKTLKTLFVTSANPGDGKTSTAINLALTIAQSGKKVIVLDADLRRPAMHVALGIPNRDGLSDLFRGHLKVQDVTRRYRDRVTVVTSGTPPPNPGELLGSRRMDQILLELQGLADVIIVDGPPFFVSDAWVLASKVDGVLVVMQPGHTRRKAARAMFAQMTRVNARVVGIALNRVSKPQGGYGRYSYLSYYYSGESEDKTGALAQLEGPRQRLQSMLRNLQKPSQATEGTAEVIEPPVNGNGHRLEVLPPAPEPSPENERSRLSLELLYALSRELATQMDLRELMQRILQMTLDSVGATSGSIIVLDDRGEAMEGVLIYDGKVQTQTAEQLEDVVERGLAGWVIENRRPVVLDNTHEDERWLQRSLDNVDSKPRSAVSVPLMADNERIVGVLTLVHPNVGHFTRDDLSLLTAIAVGVSFNSRVYTN
jgi:non-specific protein-tyrosine kinase